MKPNDPARFARELQGDFSEVDAHIRGEYIKIGLVLAFLLFWWWMFA